ncbi:MAG: hypothetical protein NVS3B21_10040 [Acidimicrobiales bacterium]
MMKVPISHRQLLVGVALILVIAAAQRCWAWRDQVDLAHSREVAVAAATTEVTKLISVSARGSRKAFDELIAGATSGFRDDLRAQATQLEKALGASSVKSEGTVVSAGLTNSSADRATVIIAATGTVSNSSTSSPERRDYRIKVELSRIDDRWLVSALEFVA